MRSPPRSGFDYQRLAKATTYAIPCPVVQVQYIIDSVQMLEKAQMMRSGAMRTQ
ncbi:MAG: hypothetical protein AB4352_13505 [Hormoscilla sp.]